MLRMVSYPHRPQSGHITCYLNRTYHVLPTAFLICLDLCSCQEHTPPESPLCRAVSNRRKSIPDANESFAAKQESLSFLQLSKARPRQKNCHERGSQLRSGRNRSGDLIRPLPASL